MTKQFKSKCPCCNDDVLVTIENDNLTITHLETELSQIEISEVLSKLNIELG